MRLSDIFKILSSKDLQKRAVANRSLSFAIAVFTVFGMNAHSDYVANSLDMPAEETGIQEQALQETKPRHSVFVAAGYSHIISKVVSTWTSGEPRLGWDWQAGYSWMFKKDMGIGLLYSGYCASGSEIAPSGYTSIKVKEKLYINYLAPQFVERLYLGQGKWSLNFAAGAGLAILTQTGKAGRKNNSVKARHSDYGWGLNLYFGAEYRLSRCVGITGGLSNINSFISQDPDDYPGYYDRDKSNGFSRISIDFGIKFNF